ncbi:hypothetical protein F5878DRAFT_607889 [Lentinula raphanica]|uniref:Copper-fist domain-containing protein n=1 Tax=Lentinula raphanica TaxID=153919 RepID=A0AA38UHW0_9AGAR|nr:hypothetical protein F5878DRAFT_607889 [Lentinula raphanica]
MVLIESKKYACETCIKGHRSSACKHTGRALYEIKKKGRPVTQCEHCRELRKTKQVHVKCICHKEETIVGGEQTSGCSKQGVNKMLESAAFPNGLPKALEASVAGQLLSQGATSDSDIDSCSCLSGDECHCWTPRKAAPRVRKKGKSTIEQPTSTPAQTPESSSQAKAPNTSNVQSRLADLRTLLPKPAHNPSSSAVLHSSGRYHPHELFSPYGRAHDHVHSNHPLRHNSKSPQADDMAVTPNTFLNNVQRPPYSLDRTFYRPRALSTNDDPRPSQVIPRFDAVDIEVWKSFQTTGPADIAGSLCGCGNECSCPGCIIHKPNINRAELHNSNCSQPDACRSCLDCAASLSYEPSNPLPSNTALSIYDNAYSLSGVDDWIRQMQSSIPAASFYGQSQSVSTSNLTSNSPAVVNQFPLDDRLLRGAPGVMYANASGDPSALFGRSRSFDDLLLTYPSSFNTSVPLDLSFLNGDSQDFLLNSATSLTPSLQSVVATSVGLDLAESVYRSRSASAASSETSGNDGNASLSALSDWGEMSSMSMFYQPHGGRGGGGGSSVNSLPDTMG